ncbi:hypothetical protein PoB_003699300 [Plakobranchus ocellatus]|uniref:Uncharacterized protein n=1 Tax=Plakobranchus ocellatus TaxID=259542 RepID=A0AAV4AUJ0_9GAST|nr:hypothetical protein PoB_003699300 [Plakobranchus ocellatus]
MVTVMDFNEVAEALTDIGLTCTALLASPDDFMFEGKVINNNDKTKEEHSKVLKDILKKMKCLMSDKASVMKSFNQKVSEFRQALLVGEGDVSKLFLFCNAHFLSGLDYSEHAKEEYDNQVGKLKSDRLEKLLANARKFSVTWKLKSREKKLLRQEFKRKCKKTKQLKKHNP